MFWKGYVLLPVALDQPVWCLLRQPLSHSRRVDVRNDTTPTPLSPVRLHLCCTHCRHFLYSNHTMPSRLLDSTLVSPSHVPESPFHFQPNISPPVRRIEVKLHVPNFDAKPHGWILCDFIGCRFSSQPRLFFPVKMAIVLHLHHFICAFDFWLLIHKIEGLFPPLCFFLIITFLSFLILLLCMSLLLVLFILGCFHFQCLWSPCFLFLFQNLFLTSSLLILCFHP